MDGGLEIADGTSPGSFSSLNINSGYLFIGGIPAMVVSTSLLSQVTILYSTRICIVRLASCNHYCLQPPVPVLACFYVLSINGVYEDLSSPQASAGVEQCLAVYNNIVTFNQQSYLLISKFLLCIS